MEDMVLKNAMFEAYEIIINLNEILMNKIPNEIMLFLYANKNDNHNFLYDENKSILDQKILPETKQLISIIYHDYICEDEKERLEIEEAWNTNQKNLEFDTRKFFENRNNSINKIDNTKEVKEKSIAKIDNENVFTKLLKKVLHKIYKLFHNHTD